MTIAANADYMYLCRSIVDQTAASNLNFSKLLEQVCLIHGLQPARLKQMLEPAAKALGLIHPEQSLVDYYGILGVGYQANAQEIKKAFREKVVQVHPDANAKLAGGNQPFIELNDAYRTLKNPESRRDYDNGRNRQRRWCERQGLSLMADSKPPMFFWYLFGLLVIFAILLLVVDIVLLPEYVPKSI